MWLKRILKALLVSIISIFGLLVLIFIILNLPFSHRFISGKINKIFIATHLPIQINSVKTVLPGIVYVEGVIIKGAENDTIIYAGKLHADFKTLALLRNKVIIKDAELDKIRVSFLRDSHTGGLNISNAFSSGKTEKDTIPAGKKKKWDVTVLKAVLSDVSFRMTDSAGGIFINEDVSKIKIVADKMSIVEKTVMVETLEIEGATGSIKLNSGNSEENDTIESATWNFGLRKLYAENTNQVFENSAGKFKVDLVSGEIKLVTRKTDLVQKKIDFDQISVSRTNLILNMDTKFKNPDENKTAADTTFSWDIQGGDINLQQVACSMFRYSDTPGHDPLSNISVSDLSLRLSDLKLNDTDLKAKIKEMNFDLGNGFSLKKLKAILDSNKDKTNLDLEVETSGSSVKIKAFADESIFGIIKNHSEIKNADIAVEKSSISLIELLKFRPELESNKVLGMLSSSGVNFSGDLKLEGSELTLPSFSISMASDIAITLNGKIENIFSPKNSTGDLQFRVSKIDNGWVKGLLGKLETAINIPEYKTLTLEGSISDSLVSPDFNLKLKSDLGNIDLSGSYNFIKDIFEIKSDFNDLMAGKILDNRLFGSFSGSANISGNGIKQKNIKAEAVVLVDSIRINEYTYTKSRIECKISKENYGINLLIDDPSLAMSLKANANVSDSFLSGKLDGSFRANLKNLNLFNDTLVTEGSLKADFLKERDKLESNIAISEIKLEIPRGNVNIKKFNASFKADSVKTMVTAESDFLKAQIFVAEPVNKLNGFVSDYITYLKTIIDTKHTEKLKHISSLPEMNGKINLYYNNVFRIFIPDTSLIFRNISCSVITNIAENKINYDANLIGVVYKMFNIENVKFSLADSASTMDIVINADTCQIAAQPVNNIHLTIHFADWQSLTNLKIIDKHSKLIYDFGIGSENDSSNIYLTVPSKKIILNGYTWEMNSPELLKINRKTKALSPNVEMFNNSSFIKLHSSENTDELAYTLELNNVGFESIYRTEILEGKPIGIISGSSSLSINKSSGKKIATDMKVAEVSWSDLKFKQVLLKGSYSSENQESYLVDVTANLDSSEISIKGSKPVKANRNIDFSFRQIPVNSVQPFVEQFLSDLKGQVSGDFILSTKNNVESISGDLLIKDVNLKVNSLNSSYRMPEDRIRFTGKKMILNSFKVLDSLDHELNINGSVDFHNRNSVLADIEISSSNLQVMNRKEEKRSTLFGTIFVDTKLSIKGPVKSPVLKGKVTLTRGTDIFFRQQDNLSMSESEKVLTFVSSKSSPGENNLKSEAGKSLINKTSVESIVEINPATRISIGLSKRMFNIGLVIKGGGELNYNMLVNNQVNLSGKYEVNEGSADLKMIGWPNKAFKITKGGFIRWDGKLEDPELNFEAVNKVTSSYVNPVDNKERYVNFDVTLKLSNRLSTMDVSFTINTPDQYLMSIINTLSPEEQMRQAITILLFENVDLPGISTSSNYVSEQVNQLVASQLNALTKTTIKGIDISFGIDSYVQANASGGQETKTSLSYEVRRKLMNDRAQIELSGRINDGTSQSKSTDYSLNNVSFEYRLDSAGTKFLKVYNEHTYEDVFEGEVIKTGVGLTYRKSYPAFGDIWKKDEEKRREEKTK